VLKAVIEGIDQYPGVMARWEHYAPWLEVDWVHKVRFEDMREKPHETATAMLTHGLSRVAPIFNAKLTVVAEALDVVVTAMVACAEEREKSPTFRKGVTGEWQQEFTPELKRLFKETDQNDWLERLGYERNDDW